MCVCVAHAVPCESCAPRRCVLPPAAPRARVSVGVRAWPTRCRASLVLPAGSRISRIRALLFLYSKRFIAFQFIALSNMDFNVAAPGGVPAGNAAALAARGADPAITIPAGNHFFRRVSNLVLAPVPGALVAAPTTASLSLVEAVLCDIFTTNGVAALDGLEVFLNKILPTKLEAGLAQLELEPAGIGLDPNATYLGIGHAASEVRRAIRRVRQQGGAVHPAYVLTAADFYQVEPLAGAAPAALVSLTAGPTALTFGHLSSHGRL